MCGAYFTIGLLFATCPAFCQTSIFGTVRDVRSQPLPAVEVQVQNESTGTRWKGQSDNDGSYSISGLAPDRYKVTVRLPGFRTVSHGGVEVGPGLSGPLDFTMELLGLHEVITVVSAKDDLDPSDGSSLLMQRGSPGAALPANGPDFRSAFDLMPGVVITPAGVGDAGQFSSNGQRPNTNNFRVDGVSANTGVGGTILPGSFPGASLPAMSATGSTENLGSLDNMQSVELRTSNFAPEWGERPGAEALVVSRSGSNEFHGEFFGRVRDAGWSARDWFANSERIPYQRPSYSSLGGVFGGRIRRDRTFFFVSLERSRLIDTGMELVAVPSLASRQNAPDNLKPLLEYFPYPTGQDLGGGEAEGAWENGTDAWLRDWSARIDQSLGSSGNLFFRVVGSPSSNTHSQEGIAEGQFNWTSATLGLTMGHGGFIHDLRLNYSGASISSYYASSASATQTLITSGLLPSYIEIPGGGGLLYGGVAPITTGGVPLTITELLPSSGSVQTVLGVSVPGLGQFVSSVYGRGRQDQWELRETLSRHTGRHDLRAGLDYLLLRSSRDPGLESILSTASSLQSLLNNAPLAVTYSLAAAYGGNVHAGSLFWQDSFHVSEALNIVYGLRWEVTPPTGKQVEIPTVSGFWNGTTWQTAQSGDINGTAPWPMRYNQFAPRFGLAWRIRQSDFVLRAGGGIFYDPSLGASINPINGAPFNSWLVAPGGGGGDSSNGVPMSPKGSAPDVIRFLDGPQPALRLPASYQWRLSMERSVGARGLASLAYIGSAGHNLLGNQVYVDPATGVLDRRVTLTEGSSHYEALQARYTGTFGRKLYGSASYTWSHSIDNGSEDSSMFLIHPGYRLAEARGSSSFDVRQELIAALSYRLPRTGLPGALRDWTLSGIFRARSGFPIDVMMSQPPLGQGFDNAGRPDLVPGVPIWIPDPHVAGGRRLNPAAFRAPAAGPTGTLGRNVITGNPLAQLDVSLRREIPLIRGMSAEVAVSVFNALNHPAFANPMGYLSSPLFGQPTSMQNLMLGSGTPNTGLPPLFQTGGARSAELSFRLSF
jgi:hypothetical protein